MAPPVYRRSLPAARAAGHPGRVTWLPLAVVVCNGPVQQLMVLGLAGLLAGAGVGALRSRAPRALVVMIFVLAGVALGLALLMLDPG